MCCYTLLYCLNCIFPNIDLGVGIGGAGVGAVLRGGSTLRFSEWSPRRIGGLGTLLWGPKTLIDVLYNASVFSLEKKGKAWGLPDTCGFGKCILGSTLKLIRPFTSVLIKCFLKSSGFLFCRKFMSLDVGLSLSSSSINIIKG